MIGFIEKNKQYLTSFTGKLKYNFLLIALTFQAIINFWKYKKNLMNLVSTGTHGRVEYCNGKYFGKKKNKVEKNDDENFELFK